MRERTRSRTSPTPIKNLSINSRDYYLRIGRAIHFPQVADPW